MKAIVMILLFLLMAVLSFSQVYMSCDKVTLYAYNEASREFDQLNVEMSNSLFVFTEKAITHTTPKQESVYYVKNYKENEDGEMEINVLSDVGNEYFCVLDGKDYEIRFFYKKEEQVYIVAYRIKTHW